ncbi:DNA (cytosine-5-)-methyltransferase [Burkholderia cepacia]|uniref:DNA (cytosine-5-)-methyltransferase n=1 Tax=Burkholderia cepacia TaxID=292 RepID=UPI00264F14A3|nr:DNA (cytosine-5-)-methyltransferase [Burkholderia cepacia]MDN7610955.1 DNA (cytosine-5-)-methyltransferase [Burkholderia cepacia]
MRLSLRWMLKREANLRFIDLFAGLGGFHLAATSVGGECVFASELQEDLRELYQSNFGMSAAGDIQEVPLESIPQHDLLCAGFPCQPFSKAGSQKGWKDAVRGTVFFRVVEILELHRPEFVVLENVAHFVNHDDGNTYQRVIEALDALGYEVDSHKLSPHHYGVPQIRERMYLVGRLRSMGGLGGFSWPAPIDATLDIGMVLDSHPSDAKQLPGYVIECLTVWQSFLDKFPKDSKLPSFPIWADEFGANYPYSRDTLRQFTIDELSKFRGSFGRKLKGTSKEELLQGVPNYARGKKGVFPDWKQRFIWQNRELYREHKKWIDDWLPRLRAFPHSLQKLEWNCQGEERDIWRYIIQFRASGVRVKRRTTSPSLVAMTTTQVPIVAWERRYMTVRECARLQSMDALRALPDTNGRAFKALGNAINVRVATAVIRNLLACRIGAQATGGDEATAMVQLPALV